MLLFCPAIARCFPSSPVGLVWTWYANQPASPRGALGGMTLMSTVTLGDVRKLVSGEGSHELDRLLLELQEVDQQFWDEYYRGSWNLSLGPVNLRAGFGSQAIAKIYLAFCVVCFGAGSTLVIVSPQRELGVALVVGAVFAGGSFVGQWWALQVQAEHERDARVFGAEQARRVRALSRRRERLVGRIERVRPGYFDVEE